MKTREIYRLKWRIWSRAEKRPSGCVEWVGTRDRSKGSPDLYYGVMKHGGRSHRVHRLVYALTNGPIPHGLVVRHKCDNGLCINPDHLEIGTIAQNNQDREDRGRTRRGSRVGTAKLTEEIVFDIRQMAASGILYREIADRFQVTMCTIHEIVLGISWQHVGGPIRKPRRELKRITEDQLALAIKLYEEGHSLTAIKPRIGFDPMTIRLHLIRAGIKMRTPIEAMRLAQSRRRAQDRVFIQGVLSGDAPGTPA